MPIKIRTTADSSRLLPGDTVEISRSHELKIDGDANWVGLKYRTTVQEGESATDAFERAFSTLSEQIEQMVTRTVQHVQTMSN